MRLYEAINKACRPDEEITIITPNCNGSGLTITHAMFLSSDITVNEYSPMEETGTTQIQYTTPHPRTCMRMVIRDSEPLVIYKGYLKPYCVALFDDLLHYYPGWALNTYHTLRDKGA